MHRAGDHGARERSAARSSLPPPEDAPVIAALLAPRKLGRHGGARLAASGAAASRLRRGEFGGGIDCVLMASRLLASRGRDRKPYWIPFHSVARRSRHPHAGRLDLREHAPDRAGRCAWVQCSIGVARPLRFRPANRARQTPLPSGRLDRNASLTQAVVARRRRSGFSL